MYQPSDRVRGHIEEGISFLKWLLYACSIGALVGVVGVAFYYGIDWATPAAGERCRGWYGCCPQVVCPSY